ncbi:MAG: hypothetical protein KUG77_01525 [Nannocystaceae bacterium]|nr:hypothetical protein [Nannocystaceae bacterium]
MLPSRILCSVLLSTTALTMASRARASNSARPRTAPVFDSRTCLLEVDVSKDPFLRFSYDLPYEDTDLTEDELPDSRTLRFALISQPVHPTQTLPNWLDRDDAERALDAGLIETAPDAEDVASESSEWNGRITGLRSAPRHLSCDEPREVEVDMSRTAPGVYELWAYTFEPPLNLWTHRPGLVVISDGLVTAPGAALRTVTPQLGDGPGLGVSMRGCGVVGTTVRVSWIDAAAADFADPAAWTPLAETVLADASLQLDAAVPGEVRDRGVMFRLDVERDGEQWTSGLHGPVSFSADSEGIAPIPFGGACGPAEASPVPEFGSGCSLSASRPASFLLLGLFFLPIVRKTGARRMSSTHKSSPRS